MEYEEAMETFRVFRLILRASNFNRYELLSLGEQMRENKFKHLAFENYNIFNILPGFPIHRLLFCEEIFKK